MYHGMCALEQEFQWKEVSEQDIRRTLSSKPNHDQL
jgi:hypothetical protein